MENDKISTVGAESRISHDGIVLRFYTSDILSIYLYRYHIRFYPF